MKIPAPSLGEPPVRANGSGRVDSGHGRGDGYLAYHGYYGAQSPHFSGRNNESDRERSERTHEEQESFHEGAVAPPTPSSSATEKKSPTNNFLTQSLLPVVAKRLDRYKSLVEHEEDDPRTASPPGCPAKIAGSFTQPTEIPRGGLKITGLEKSDYGNELEAGGQSAEETEEMTKYLPRSAALLVSALKMSKRGSLAPSESAEDFFSERSRAWDLEGCERAAEALLESIRRDDVSGSKNIPKGGSLAPSESAEDFFSQRSGTWGGSLAPSESAEDFFSQRSGTSGLEGCESTAEALLESTRRFDVDGREEGAVREPAPRHGRESDAVRESSSRRNYEGLPEGAAGFESSAGFGTGANATRAATLSDDDDDSIGGDVARLTTSVASIRRDLQNVDFSHLEDFGGRCISDEYEGDSLQARFKLWISRGFIMEQKLLHTYVTLDGANDDAGTATSVRYADNPVLLWSLALMWSFVVLILLNPKFAELVEGGDEGQLVDILQWLFGKDDVGWV